MIDRAIVLLPPRGPRFAVTDAVSPLAYVGGLTRIQRILYALQAAGIREGLVLSLGEWPEVEAHVRGDGKNRAFGWLALPASGPASDALDRLTAFLQGDLLLHAPDWFVDRAALAEICATETPLGSLVLCTAPDAAGDETLPPVCLLPASETAGFVRAVGDASSPAGIARWVRSGAGAETRPLHGGTAIRVATRQDLPAAERQLCRNLIKPTESAISKQFDRKISLAITRHLLRTPVTPNQISVGSILLGVLCSLLFLPDARALHVLGATLLVLSNIIDGCDGELARLRYQESRWGSYLDFIGDNVVHMVLFFCIGAGLYLRGAGTIYLVLGCLGVIGTLGSASAVFRRVFLRSGARVVTFATPVRLEEMERATGRMRKRIEFTDKISNRDFVYLVLVLAILGQLWIFAWVSALGALFYLFNLLYLYRRMRATRSASPATVA